MGNKKNRNAAKPAAARKSERIKNAQVGSKRVHSPEPEPSQANAPDASQSLSPSKRSKQLLLTAFIHSNRPEPTGTSNPAARSSVNPFEDEIASTGNITEDPESEDGYSEGQITQGTTKTSKRQSLERRGSEDESDTDPFPTPVIIPVDVETKTQIKGFDLPSTQPFALFKYEVARILDCSLAQMKIRYLTPDMKPPPGRKLCPRSLETHEEYDAMIANAVAFIKSQEIVASEEDSDVDRLGMKSTNRKKKSKGRPRGRPPKVKATTKYTITVIPDQEMGSDSKSKQAKDKGSSNRPDGSTPNHGEASDDALLMISRADRSLFNTWKLLQEARYCKKCKKSCLVVRVKNADGTITPTHRPLTYVEQKIWAEKINDGEPGVNNYMPPAELNLGDPVFKDPKQTPSKPTLNEPAAEDQLPKNPPLGIAVNAPNPSHHAPAMPLPHMGYPVPGLYPFPFPMPSHFGYQPNPYMGYNPNQATLGGPFVPPSSGPTAGSGNAPPIPIPSDFPTPLLSEWFEHCSRGYRGIDQHNYRRYLPAFENQAVVRVLDFYHLELNQIIKLVQQCDECKNYIYYGTASRLHSYAKEDVQRAVRMASMHGADHAWPGYATVNTPCHDDEPAPAVTE